jgi:hypothetical protein
MAALHLSPKEEQIILPKHLKGQQRIVASPHTK